MRTCLHVAMFCILRDTKRAYVHARNSESVTRGKPFALFQVVLDGPRAENYNNVKLVMTDKPVLIQCVQARTIKPSPGIESKCKGLLQQIVCKLGGSPWAYVSSFLHRLINRV
jgi:hypothetical protein